MTKPFPRVSRFTNPPFLPCGLSSESSLNTTMIWIVVFTPKSPSTRIRCSPEPASSRRHFLVDDLVDPLH